MKFWKKILVLNLISAIFLVLLLIVYFFKAKIFLDPDFGWGLRLGEIILNSGIPFKDPFSYTMPSYHYADHEWLTHVAMAKVYSLFGYTGLALLFTLMAIAAILVSIRGLNPRFILLQILFTSAILFPYFGIRPQVISWLFFAFVSKTALDQKYWKRYGYLMPALFLFWANLHGAFITGLIILAVSYFPRRNFKNTFIVITSVLATLINPYGLGLWREILTSTIDFSIRFYIIEWRPIVFSLTSVTLIFIAFSLAFIIHYRSRYKNHEILLYLLILLAAFSSARNIPLFLLFATVLIKKGIARFRLEVGSNKQKLNRFNLLYSFFFLAVLVVTFLQMRKDYLASATRSEDRYYPRQAVNYLSTNLPRGQIFTSYEWGGYLDWKLPQKKVFIDGRMPSWRQKSSKFESGYAFDEHNSTLQLKSPLAKVFNKYSIDTVLLPKAWLNNKKDKTTWEIAVKFVGELEKNKFKKIYQDQVALIFTRSF